MNATTQKLLRQIIFLLSIAISIVGCSSTGGTRLYSEKIRPANEVALILTADGVTKISGMSARDDQQAITLFTRTSFEVLPGRYPFCIGYLEQGYKSTSVGRNVDLTVNVELNHTYVLYAKIDRKNESWRPVFVDLNAYHQDDCGGGCYSLNELHEHVTEHFRGERPVMTQRSWGGWE
jgi:hypothetical protein